MDATSVGSGLKNVCIVDKDFDDELMFSWGFPGIELSETDEDDDIIPGSKDLTLAMAENSLSLCADGKDSFITSKLSTLWMYCKSTVVATDKDRESEGLKLVKSFCIDFNPEKYEALIDICIKAYHQTGNVRRVLGVYLAVFTKSFFSSKEYGKFTAADYTQKAAWLASNMKGLISSLGEQWVTVWAAALLKKRIVFVGGTPRQALDYVRSVPLFVSHRPRVWDVIRPYILGTEHEIEELQSMSFYICATTMLANIEYDVLVDINAKSVAISEHFRDELTVADIYKSFGSDVLAMCCKTTTTEKEIGKAIAQQLSKLTDMLHDLGHADGDNVVVSMPEIYNAPDLTDDNSRRFMYAVAIAEQMAAY